jgi:hypothetical protein
MFDHLKFSNSESATNAASKAFFLKTLEPLDVAVVPEGRRRTVSSLAHASLCLCQTDEKPAHLHLAFKAENRQQVEARTGSRYSMIGWDPSQRVSRRPSPTICLRAASGIVRSRNNTVELLLRDDCDNASALPE